MSKEQPWEPGWHRPMPTLFMAKLEDDLLAWTSARPHTWWRYIDGIFCTTSIPYSQALRCRRICSREEDFKKRTKELRTHLLDRGYHTTTVDAQIQKASCKAASHRGPESQFTQTTNQTNTFSSHIPSRTHQSINCKETPPNPSHLQQIEGSHPWL